MGSAPASSATVAKPKNKASRPASAPTKRSTSSKPAKALKASTGKAAAPKSAPAKKTGALAPKRRLRSKHAPALAEEPADNVIVARDLRKTFGDFVAVEGISFEVPRGTCFGLLGPNGAGKTTTIKMIDCTSPLSAGSLHVLGMDTRSDRRAIKQRLGLVPQDDNLDPDFTVHKNLSVFARFFGIKAKIAHQRADELLDFVSLAERRDSHINTLSGGMKRRLVVARSLVNDPDILILDEPTTGLDPQARHTIWDKIRALRREGKTVLLTTHYMDEAEMLCDELVVIDQGKIIEQGNPKDLIKKHTDGKALELVVAHEDAAQLADLSDFLTKTGVPHERLSERIIAYGPKLRQVEAKARKNPSVQEMIERRATLEDVFLRLTGRALRD